MNRTQRWNTAITTAAFFATLPAMAQPEVFTDLGAYAAPLSPPSQITGVGAVVGGDNGPELLSVRWYRFELTETIAQPAFLQATTTASTLLAPQPNLSIALYDGAGSLVASESRLVSAGLSFGSTVPGPRTNDEVFGRDGLVLASGTYYIAIIAGGENEVTLGTTGWNVSTTTTLPLDLDDLLTSYALSFSISLGNSDPRFTEPPANDSCANAQPVTRNVQWIGTNELATSDGDVSCYVSNGGPLIRNVWLRYTADISGRAEVLSTVEDIGDAVLPLLARFDTCDQPPVQCGLITVVPGNVGSRLAFDVVAGQSYLFGLSGAQGSTGPVNFFIDVTPTVGCDTVDFNGNSVFPEDQDVVDFFTVLAGGDCPTSACGDLDFNNNGVFPEDQDVIDFFTVLAGGAC